MTIYVVSGSIGEYSDQTEWLVKAFTDEEKAKELVISASDRARVIAQNKEEDDYNSYSDEPQLDKFKNPFDPKADYFNYSYDSAKYEYNPLELEGI